VTAAEELGLVTGQKLNEDIPMEADILAGGSIGLISQVNKRTELYYVTFRISQMTAIKAG